MPPTRTWCLFAELPEVEPKQLPSVYSDFLIRWVHEPHAQVLAHTALDLVAHRWDCLRCQPRPTTIINTPIIDLLKNRDIQI